MDVVIGFLVCLASVFVVGFYLGWGGGRKVGLGHASNKVNEWKCFACAEDGREKRDGGGVMCVVGDHACEAAGNLAIEIRSL